MDTEIVSLFLEVAEVGSFAGVAKRRRIDPSQVSRSISNLEESIGVRLFQRTTRRMTITAEGQAFYDRVKPLIDELDEALDVLTTGHQAVDGMLSVTVSVAFGTHWLMPRLDAFLQAHERLLLDLQLSDAVVDLIAERMDLAIRLAKPTESTLVARKLMDVTYRAVANKTWAEHISRNNPGDLAARQYVAMNLPGLRSELRVRTANGEMASMPVQPRILMNSAATVRSAMIEGLGYAVLPDWLIDNDVNSGRCIDLLPDFEVAGTSFDGGVWLVYPNRRYLPARVSNFVEYLRTCVPSER